MRCAVPEPSLPLKLSIGLPGIVTFGIGVDSDDVSALFTRNRKSHGPFLLIGRDRGLALDTGGRAADEAPLLWPPNAGPRQLWYFRKTKHRGKYLIVSIDNELVLDARESTETPREPVMWPEHSQSHQRWRLRPTDNAAAFFIESLERVMFSIFHGTPKQIRRPRQFCLIGRRCEPAIPHRDAIWRATPLNRKRIRTRPRWTAGELGVPTCGWKCGCPPPNPP